LGINIPDAETNGDVDEIESKRKKSNICIACLGLFDNVEVTIARILADPELKKYDVRQFLSSISLPIIMHFNQLLIWIHLIDKYPEFDWNYENPPDTPSKEVARHIINSRVSQIIDKPVTTQEGLMINIFYEVSNEDQLKQLEELFPELFLGKLLNMFLKFLKSS
jgi:hypothetical protein